MVLLRTYDGARWSTIARADRDRTRSTGATRRSRPARSTRSTRGLDLSQLPRVGDRACAASRGDDPFLVGHPAGWWSPEDYNVASICVPIATQVPHAAGFAWGKLRKRLRGETACALTFFGDGATSEGAFHEARTSPP